MILKLKLDIIGLISGFLTLNALGLEVENAEEINPFLNPFIYFFIFLGIVMTLGKDYHDKKRRVFLTTTYVLWSITISVGFSILVALAWKNDIISEFYSYCAVIGVSAFSPIIIDKYRDEWITTIGKSITDTIVAFFEWIKRKINN